MKLKHTKPPTPRTTKELAALIKPYIPELIAELRRIAREGESAEVRRQALAELRARGIPLTDGKSDG